jgi:hypothetical protein
MKKILFFGLIFSSALFADMKQFKLKFKGGSLGFACTRAKGKATSKIQAMCKRIDKVMDWEKTSFGSCTYKKNKKAPAKQRWEASWTIKPACKKGTVVKKKKKKKKK